MSKQLAKARYISSLLGRKREVYIAGVEDNPEDSQYFDTLLKMSDNQTDLSKELLTETVELQKQTEDSIKRIYDEILNTGEIPVLNKSKHSKFLKLALGQLPSFFKGLDASQPWILYWVLNALYLLGEDTTPETKKEIGEKVLKFIHKEGGIGGGLGQEGHAAATYAGINTLVLLGDEEVWSRLDRAHFYQWLLKLKLPDGSFTMHVGGEVDARAVYCVLTIASLLDIITPELIEGTAQWLGRCQTFEGGFGGVPFDEAHGGYTFCAVAALLILGKETFLKHTNVDKLLEWTVSRQLPLEGGFQGRSNKLVDGCYSFWVGGIVSIFDILFDHEVISREALSHYIISCCQNEDFGGLRDKPSTKPDYYHSNYVLLGLSVVQNRFFVNAEKNIGHGVDKFAYSIDSRPTDVGEKSVGNKVLPINPVFALPAGYAETFKLFWSK